MPDITETKDPKAAADAERKAKRRSKLRSLAGKRPSSAEGIAAPDTTGSVPQVEAEGGNTAARRKAIGRIYRVLSETPADDTGMVEGTPFTKAGVLRLLETLKARTAKEGQPGAKVAAGILKFMSPKEGEAHVHGVSLERLQRVAKTAKGRRDKGKKQRGLRGLAE